MATVNLGRIKPVFRGAYNNSTSYVVDDIVTSGNETFIAIQAGSGNATSNASYWTKLAAKGTDGTDVGTTITTQGDILYRDGSGLQRLGAGTNGQALLTGGSGANPSWGTITQKFVNATFLEITARATTGSQTSDQTVFGNMGSFTKQYDASTSNIFYSAVFPTVDHGNDNSYHDLKCVHSDSTAVNNYAHLYYASNATAFSNNQVGSGKLNGLKAGTWTMSLILKSNGVANNGGHTYNPNSSSDNTRSTPSAYQKSRVTLFEILI